MIIFLSPFKAINPLFLSWKLKNKTSWANSVGQNPCSSLGVKGWSIAIGKILLTTASQFTKTNEKYEFQ